MGVAKTPRTGSIILFNGESVLIGVRLALEAIGNDVTVCDVLITPGSNLGAKGLSAGALLEVANGGGGRGVCTTSEGGTRSSSPPASSAGASARPRNGLLSCRTVETEGCIESEGWMDDED